MNPPLREPTATESIYTWPPPLFKPTATEPNYTKYISHIGECTYTHGRWTPLIIEPTPT